MPRKTSENPLGLEPYEGMAVSEIGMEIPAAGGGLREPLECDMVTIDLLKKVTHGDHVFVLMELEKQKVRHQAAKTHDGWMRVDIYKPCFATVVQKGVAIDMLEETRLRVVEAQEAAEMRRLKEESDAEREERKAAGEQEFEMEA